MRGRASSTPKVPWETVTGSVTPRASQSVSASRSNVKAHAARAPCGQAAAVTLAGTRSGRGGTVPRDGEPEPEHAPAGLVGAERSPTGRFGEVQPAKPMRPDPVGVWYFDENGSMNAGSCSTMTFGK